MAYKVHKDCYLEPDDDVSRNCIWCGAYCETTEVLDNGEEIELWCYCDKCDSECFNKITKMKTKVKITTYKQSGKFNFDTELWTNLEPNDTDGIISEINDKWKNTPAFTFEIESENCFVKRLHVNKEFTIQS